MRSPTPPGTLAYSADQLADLTQELIEFVAQRTPGPLLARVALLRAGDHFELSSEPSRARTLDISARADRLAARERALAREEQEIHWREMRLKAQRESLRLLEDTLPPSNRT